MLSQRFLVGEIEFRSMAESKTAPSRAASTTPRFSSGVLRIDQPCTDNVEFMISVLINVIDYKIQKRKVRMSRGKITSW